MVVFVNPNNPTGALLPTDWILTAFAAARPDKLVIVDESFLAFSAEASIVDRLERAPLANVLVLASLSKSLGIPGARLGYAYACDAALAGDIGRSVPIWNLNSVAEHVLEIAVKHRVSLADSFRATAVDREAFAADLASVPGVAKVHASGGNFLLVTLAAEACRPGAVDALADRLLTGHTMYVKNATERIADGQAHLRLAVRLPDENQRFCSALAAELQRND